MTSFSTRTLCDVIDFVVAVCHCSPILAYELRTSTRRFPAKFQSQTDFFIFRNSLINVLIKMPNFRENRECIAYAYRKGFLNDRQFVCCMMPILQKTRTSLLWKCDRFDLGKLGNEQCKDFTKLTFSSLLSIFNYRMRSYCYLQWPNSWIEVLLYLSVSSALRIIAVTGTWFLTLLDLFRNFVLLQTT